MPPACQPSRARRVVPTVRLCPCVALLDDEAIRVECEQRRPGERLLGPVWRGDDCPPVDCRTRSVDYGLSEPTLRRRLIREGPGDVLGGRLAVAKRMRAEDGVICIERRDGRDVRARPRLLPDRSPAARPGPRFYFATSIARLSRMTITFTWPGYSS